VQPCSGHKSKIPRVQGNVCKTNLGNNVGIHATLENADISREFILASSDTPPDFESGPTASTRHRINSLQKPCIKLIQSKQILE
jgi:hypothetical protein